MGEQKHRCITLEETKAALANNDQDAFAEANRKAGECSLCKRVLMKALADRSA